MTPKDDMTPAESRAYWVESALFWRKTLQSGPHCMTRRRAEKLLKVARIHAHHWSRRVKGLPSELRSSYDSFDY